MTIEAEFYSRRRNRAEEFHGNISISPGSAEIITHLKPTDVLVILNIDNTRGEIRIKKPNRVIAFKYRDEDDEDGIRVDPSKPIEIKSGQEILIRKIGRKTLKEARLWLEPNDGSYNKVPNPEVQTPVLV